MSQENRTGLPPIIEATEPGAPISLDAHLKTLEAEIAKVKAIKAAAAPIVVPPAPAPAAEKSAIEKILNHPMFYVVLIGAYFFGSNYLKNNKGIEMDRWNGLLIHAYNFAEEAGLTKGLKGRDKLRLAMEEFKRQHIETYGTRATAQDEADFVNDIAKLAYDDDTTANLRASRTAIMDPIRYDNAPRREVSAGLGETPRV